MPIGFSIVLESTGCSRGSAFRLIYTVSVGGTNFYGGPGACFPWKVFNIGLSKMQFPVFPGPELINWEGLLRQRNICFCNFLL